MKKQYISPSAIVMDLHLESSVAQLLVGSREGDASQTQTEDEAWTQKKQDNLYWDILMTTIPHKVIKKHKVAGASTAHPLFFSMQHRQVNE